MRSRFYLLRELLWQRTTRVVGIGWLVVSVYDTAVGQFMDEETQERLPQARYLVASWSPWVWVILGLIILWVLTFESAYRHSAGSGSLTRELVDLIQEAMELHRWCGDKSRSDDPAPAVEEWHRKIEALLNSIDATLVARLHNWAGLSQMSGSYPLSFSAERIEAHRDLGFDLQRLNEFLSELRDG